MYRTVPITYRMADAFFRNRWHFLIAFLVISSVTMSALYLRSRTYTATALTLVNTDNVASELGEGENYGWSTPAQKNTTQLQTLLAGNFLDAAFKNAAASGQGLRVPIDTNPAAEDPRYQELTKKLSVYAQGDNLFAVNLTWDNPAEAEAIVRAVQNEYIQEIGQEHYAQTAATLAFLESQISLYGGRLASAEEALTAYKKTHAGQLPEQQSANIGQLSALQAQLDNMKITAHDSAAQKSVLLQRLAQITPQTVAEQTSAPSPLDVQINQMRAQRDAMLTRWTLVNPHVVEISAQIAALEQQRDGKRKAGAGEAQDVTQTKLQDNPEWQALHQQLVEASIAQQTQAMQMQKLEQGIAQYEKIVSSIPAEQKELTEKTRDYTVVLAQYNALLQKREQVQIDGNLARVTASSSLTPIGYIHAEPTTGKAKMMEMFAGSLLLGLIVGLVLVILSEWADNSLRYGADATRSLGVPVLGVLPQTSDLMLSPPPADQPRLGGGGLRRLLSAPKDKDKDAAPDNDRFARELPAAPAMSASAVEGTQS